jgi:hypothetical protein
MESKPGSSSSIVPKVVGAIVALLLCCACIVMAAAGIIIYQAYRQAPPEITPTVIPATETSTPPPTSTPETPTAEPVSLETIDVLNQTLVPTNDPYALACRLKGICNIATTVPGKSYQVGDREKFWVSNADTAEHRQGNFTLLYITPHSYFWAEDGANANLGDVKALMDTFESKIYPTNREFFGSEWIPGVDGDERIFVIYANDLGRSVAGYYNSKDEYNPLVNEYSNAHETFFISTTQDLTREFTYGVLAHEFVHMIQFSTDQNDNTWLTEGFADVGMFLNGYSVGNHDWAYVQDPDLQLTDWEGSAGDNGPHYGQSFLYLAYFLDRFGEEATKSLTNNPMNDLPSVDDTLAQLNITDPQTGKIITADDVFMDWAAALYLKDKRVGDGRYTYHNYPDAPQTSSADEIYFCPEPARDYTVNQYGIDYISIQCPGDFTLQFKGSTDANLLPVDARSGKYAFWSNKGDESNMTLTREFDFSGAGGPINISYWTWYDIEQDWDYLYLEASTDGQNWEILKTPSGTDTNPSGNSYGWGYTGATEDWIEETVDLSRFAGQKIWLRFEYITDAAVTRGGLLLDDVSIDAINYRSEFEADDGGWTAEGFAHVQNVLPQTYHLSLILKGNSTTVTSIPLNPDNAAEIPLSLKRGDEAILVVTGTTRFTTIPAAYQIEVK